MQPRASGSKEALDDPILERVEADDHKASTRSEHLHGRRERSLETAELVVDGYAERLEGPLRRMAVAEPAWRRHRLPDGLDQVVGSLVGPFATTTDDVPGDLSRVPLFAVPAKDVGQVALVGTVDELHC